MPRGVIQTIAVPVQALGVLVIGNYGIGLGEAAEQRTVWPGGVPVQARG